MNIRPVSDLRNKYPDVENDLYNSGAVYLTKNGYGVAVLIGVEEYAELTGKTILGESRKNPRIQGCRGFLHKYANSELLEIEKDAARIHTLKKYGKGGEK